MAKEKCEEGKCEVEDLADLRDGLINQIPKLEGRLSNGTDMNSMLKIAKLVGGSEATINYLNDQIRIRACSRCKRVKTAKLIFLF